MIELTLPPGGESEDKEESYWHASWLASGSTLSFDAWMETEADAAILELAKSHFPGFEQIPVRQQTSLRSLVEWDAVTFYPGPGLLDSLREDFPDLLVPYVSQGSSCAGCSQTLSELHNVDVLHVDTGGVILILLCEQCVPPSRQDRIVDDNHLFVGYGDITGHPVDDQGNTLLRRKMN